MNINNEISSQYFDLIKEQYECGYHSFYDVKLDKKIEIVIEHIKLFKKFPFTQYELIDLLIYPVLKRKGIDFNSTMNLLIEYLEIDINQDFQDIKKFEFEYPFEIMKPINLLSIFDHKY